MYIFFTQCHPPPFPPHYKLERCAFYGDCDHEIEEVTQGYRLTLTYILRYDPADQGIAKNMAASMGPIAPVQAPGSRQGDESCSEDDLDVMTEIELLYYNSSELKELCRERGLKVKGCKMRLKNRLMGKEKEDGFAGRKGWKRADAVLPDPGTYPTSLAATLGAELHGEIKGCLESEQFLQLGGLIGVPCMHLYEQVRCVCVFVSGSRDRGWIVEHTVCSR